MSCPLSNQNPLPRIPPCYPPLFYNNNRGIQTYHVIEHAYGNQTLNNHVAGVEHFGHYHHRSHHKPEHFGNLSNFGHNLLQKQKPNWFSKEKI